jgi:hypothetical protein
MSRRLGAETTSMNSQETGKIRALCWQDTHGALGLLHDGAAAASPSHKLACSAAGHGCISTNPAPEKSAHDFLAVWDLLTALREALLSCWHSGLTPVTQLTGPTTKAICPTKLLEHMLPCSQSSKRDRFNPLHMQGQSLGAAHSLLLVCCSTQDCTAA